MKEAKAQEVIDLMCHNRATVCLPDGSVYWETTLPGEYRVRIEEFGRERVNGRRKRKGKFVFSGTIVASPIPEDIGLQVTLPFKGRGAILPLIEHMELADAVFRKEEWIPIDDVSGGIEHNMHHSLWELVHQRREFEEENTTIHGSRHGRGRSG